MVYRKNEDFYLKESGPTENRAGEQNSIEPFRSPACIYNEIDHTITEFLQHTCL